jgi:hypothetical protein
VPRAPPRLPRRLHRIAFCEPFPNYSPGKPWDEQFSPDKCSGFANVGQISQDCGEKPFFYPTWGRPAHAGELGPPEWGTRKPMGGTCELKHATRNGGNEECYNKPDVPPCSTAHVRINEVDGEASGAGADWIEVVSDAPGMCELRDCQFIFSECAEGEECADMEYTDTWVHTNIEPGGHKLFFENTDFIPPLAGYDYIPARPTKPLSVSM